MRFCKLVWFQTDRHRPITIVRNFPCKTELEKWSTYSTSDFDLTNWIIHYLLWLTLSMTQTADQTYQTYDYIRFTTVKSKWFQHLPDNHSASLPPADGLPHMKECVVQTNCFFSFLEMVTSLGLSLPAQELSHFLVELRVHYQSHLLRVLRQLVVCAWYKTFHILYSYICENSLLVIILKKCISSSGNYTKNCFHIPTEHI